MTVEEFEQSVESVFGECSEETLLELNNNFKEAYQDLISRKNKLEDKNHENN